MKVYLIEISDGFGKYAIEAIFDNELAALSYIIEKIKLVNERLSKDKSFEMKGIFEEYKNEEIADYKKENGVIKQWSNNFLNVYLIEKELNKIITHLENFCIYD